MNRLQLRLFATAPSAGPHRVSSRLVSVAAHTAAVSVLLLVGVRPHARPPAPRIEPVAFVDVSRAAPSPSPGSPPALAPPGTPSKGFQTLAAPTTVPDQVPPADTASAFDAADFSGQGLEGGTASGVKGEPPSAEAEPTTYELSEVSVLPKMLQAVKPDYPHELLGIRGTVLLRAYVLPSGDLEPETVQVVKPLNPVLDEAAIQALRRTKFSPAYFGGHPVRVAVLVPYRFDSR
jgi:protein TonB